MVRQFACLLSGRVLKELELIRGWNGELIEYTTSRGGKKEDIPQKPMNSQVSGFTFRNEQQKIVR